MKGRHLPGAKPSSAPSPRQPIPNDLLFGEWIHNLISEELERAKNDKARAFHAVVARLKDDPALFERMAMALIQKRIIKLLKRMARAREEAARGYDGA